MNSLKTIIILLLIFQYGVNQVFWRDWRYTKAIDCPKGTRFIESSDENYLKSVWGKDKGYCIPNIKNCKLYNKEKMNCTDCERKYTLVLDSLKGNYCEKSWYWAYLYFFIGVCVGGGIIMIFVGCCRIFDKSREEEISQKREERKRSRSRASCQDLNPPSPISTPTRIDKKQEKLICETK